VHAAAEVNSAIVASTSTNLSAVLPFLFIGGLTGLLFRELIFTISAAILASMVIALTLVPALAAKVRSVKQSAMRKAVDNAMVWLQDKYSAVVGRILRFPWPVPVIFAAALIASLPTFLSGKQIFLPKMDDGLVTIRLLTDPGTTLEEMDRTTQMIENMLFQQQEVESVFTLAGGSIFGRTEREIPNRTTISVQLVPLAQRAISSGEWIKQMQKQIAAKQVAGLKVRIYQRGIRGIRTSRGDDDISLRIQGPNLKKLEELAGDLVLRLQTVKGLNNVAHSAEEENFEISIQIDRDRAKNLGLDVKDISQAMQIALEGIVVTDFIQGDRAYDVRLRLPRNQASDPQDLESIVLFPAVGDRPPVYLGSVARAQLVEAPATIMRDAQMRIIEVTASVAEDATLGGVLKQIDTVLADLPLPQGYNVYDGGAKEALQEGRQMTYVLLALALFLVFVVMAVQYESLRNPVVIIFSVPFSAIGVAIGIYLVDMPISMPVWLGMIMLAGIVVNNAIVLVEYIEILREKGMAKTPAIVEAARLRLRPILMTTLTTVVGMLPLALGWGEGAEMLQPLAVTIVSGLSFSVLVSLLFVPVVYSLFHLGEATTQLEAETVRS
jgi:multidrug efflux pump subunit AcrB